MKKSRVYWYKYIVGSWPICEQQFYFSTQSKIKININKCTFWWNRKLFYEHEIYMINPGWSYLFSANFVHFSDKSIVFWCAILFRESYFKLFLRVNKRLYVQMKAKNQNTTQFLKWEITSEIKKSTFRVWTFWTYACACSTN